MMDEVLIQTDRITKEYTVGTSRVIAINGITLTINKGEFIAILGKSGSGKSTFVSLIGGLTQPSSGWVRLKDQDLSQLSEDQLAILRRNEISIVFQHFYLLDSMTAQENVELPLLIASIPKRERRERAQMVLNLVGLTDRKANYPHELSGGEKQRVGIARALVTNPSIILADEPTGDLDSATGDNIIELLQSLNQNSELKTTILMVTHDISKLRKGMRILKFSDGIVSRDLYYLKDEDLDLIDEFGTPNIIKSSSNDEANP